MAWFFSWGCLAARRMRVVRLLTCKLALKKEEAAISSPQALSWEVPGPRAQPPLSSVGQSKLRGYPRFKREEKWTPTSSQRSGMGMKGREKLIVVVFGNHLLHHPSLLDSERRSGTSRSRVSKVVPIWSCPRKHIYWRPERQEIFSSSWRYRG